MMKSQMIELYSVPVFVCEGVSLGSRYVGTVGCQAFRIALALRAIKFRNQGAVVYKHEYTTNKQTDLDLTPYFFDSKYSTFLYLVTYHNHFDYVSMAYTLFPHANWPSLLDKQSLYRYPIP